MIKSNIVNVVATASLNQDIDLDKLRQFKGIIYDPNRYRGKVAYLKTNQMQGKVSIFSSGKMISIGTKSEEQARKELQQTIQFLVDKHFIKEVKLKPKTQNIVTTIDFEQTINLEDFAQRTRSIYEPDQFSGAILRLTQPFKTSILVFSSGKIVITGLKDSKQVVKAVEKIKQLIFE